MQCSVGLILFLAIPALRLPYARRPSHVITRSERPLNEIERRELATRLHRARTESASAAICGVLGFLTALASDAPVSIIFLFWLAMALLFTGWIGWPWHKLMRSQIPVLEGALRANRAVETRIQSARVVEFEEFDDEGACYAFELESGTCIFIVGQEFYEDDDFPNTDFSMVDLLGEGATSVTTLLKPREARSCNRNE